MTITLLMYHLCLMVISKTNAHPKKTLTYMDQACQKDVYHSILNCATMHIEILMPDQLLNLMIVNFKMPEVLHFVVHTLTC